MGGCEDLVIDRAIGDGQTTSTLSTMRILATADVTLRNVDVVNSYGIAYVGGGANLTLENVVSTGSSGRLIDAFGSVVIDGFTATSPPDGVWMNGSGSTLDATDLVISGTSPIALGPVGLRVADATAGTRLRNVTLSGITNAMILGGAGHDLDGVTIRNSGGASWSPQEPSTFANLIYEGNTGQFTVSGSDASLVGPTFRDNTSPSSPLVVSSSGFALSAGLFEGNAGSDGGAVRLLDGGTISNTTFDANTATGNGGAVHAIDDAATSPGVVLSDVVFTGNAAGAIGGAVHLGADVTGTLETPSFTNNSATGGGGVFWVVPPIVTDATFDGNLPDDLASSCAGSDSIGGGPVTLTCDCTDGCSTTP
jgi:predicted outer membrane repeat protein